jgi:hypothetical protein
MTRSEEPFMSKTCLVITLMLAMCDPARAFNPDEHRGLSNEALEICSKLLVSHASMILPANPDEDRLTQVREALDFLLREPKKSTQPDYGMLVLSVDHYSISPDLDFRGSRLFENRKSAQLGMNQRNPHSHWWAIGLRRLGAVHTNEIHFQGGAVAGAQYFHAEATKRAANALDATDLKQAFILNAIADHLMQDFLAGGHVVTPRANFHDLAAAVIHDSYNRAGVPFHLQTESVGWNHLKELASEIEHQSAQETGLEPISDQLSAFVSQAEKRGTEDYKFYGDGRLTCNIDQRTYMLLIATRSTLDVIDSFLLREPTDKTGSGSWCWTPALAFAEKPVDKPEELKDIMQPPRAGTSSGEYNLKEIMQVYESPDGFKIHSLMAAYSTTDLFRQGSLDLDYITNSSIPSGAVLLSKRDGTTENAYKNPDWTFFAPGLAYFFSPGLRAVDIHISVFGPLWGPDAPLSIRLGLGAYRHDGRTDKKLNGGISIGKGFGLLYGEVRFDRSYVAQSGGRLHGRWAPSIGARALLPATWISRILRHKQACN